MLKKHEQNKTLKTLIDQADTNQRALSLKIGVHERTINDWVARKKIPKLDNALLIAKELQVSLRELADSLGLDVSGLPYDLPPADK